MACTWIAIECKHPACTWVWTGYASAGKMAWAAHNTIDHLVCVKASCDRCDPDAFEFCRQCGGGVDPGISIEPFSVCSYESSVLAALLERAVVARHQVPVPVERAAGRRGGYEGAFLCNGIVQRGKVHRIVCILDLLASASEWILRVALAAAPPNTPITPLLSNSAATKAALKTGLFTPSGGRCVLSLRAAVEVASVCPDAIVAAATAWKSQYLPCAVAACKRSRRGVATALAAVPSTAAHAVIMALLADTGSEEAVRLAIAVGFPVIEDTLWIALKTSPVNLHTLGILLQTKEAIGDSSITAAASIAAYDPAGLTPLQAVLAAGGSEVIQATGAHAAMRTAILTGNGTMLAMLIAEGGTLPRLVPGDDDGIRAVVGAVCKLRGQSRRVALNLLFGSTDRATEIWARAQEWGAANITQWACAMLDDADGLGARLFVQWVGPILDKCRSWTPSIRAATSRFAQAVRPDEYLAIVTAYGSSCTACPLVAMPGLLEADADIAIQWLVDCRPHALCAAELANCAVWSPTAALAIDATSTGRPLRPAWWKRVANMALLCTKGRLPPELARHICTFVLSQTAPMVRAA